MAGMRKPQSPFSGGLGGSMGAPQGPPQAPQMGQMPGGAVPMQSKDPSPVAMGQQAGGGMSAPRGANVGQKQPQAPMAPMPPQAPLQPFNPLPAIPMNEMVQPGLGQGLPAQGAMNVKRRTPLG